MNERQVFNTVSCAVEAPPPVHYMQAYLLKAAMYYGI